MRRVRTTEFPSLKSSGQGLFPTVLLPDVGNLLISGRGIKLSHPCAVPTPQFVLRYYDLFLLLF